MSAHTYRVVPSRTRRGTWAIIDEAGAELRVGFGSAAAAANVAVQAERENAESLRLERRHSDDTLVRFSVGDLVRHRAEGDDSMASRIERLNDDGTIDLAAIDPARAAAGEDDFGPVRGIQPDDLVHVAALNTATPIPTPKGTTSMLTTETLNAAANLIRELAPSLESGAQDNARYIAAQITQTTDEGVCVCIDPQLVDHLILAGGFEPSKGEVARGHRDAWQDPDGDLLDTDEALIRALKVVAEALA